VRESIEWRYSVIPAWWSIAETWPGNVRLTLVDVFFVVMDAHGPMETMLKTGEVARLLGVSRQHVADMCDRGEIEHIRVGTHRRVPRSEVDRLMGHRLTRQEEKSLRLHQALLTPMLAEPDAVISKARDNLQRWTGMHRPDGITARYLEEWKRVLDDGLDAIVDVVISHSQEARELRQNSPFAGVLPDETRRQVLRAFKDHWSREHEPVFAA
jgi:excisionase family DNA binding protein